MPNHVKNIIRLSGEQSDIDKVLAFVKTDESLFDFNAIIPMPKSLQILSGGRCTLGLEAYTYRKNGNVTDAKIGERFSILIDLYETNGSGQSLDEYIDILIQQGKCDLNLGMVAFDNLQEYGHTTWFDWCVAVWGTKWNAYCVEMEDNKISFQTAWAAPTPVIEQLANRFQNIEIDHCWSDEDIGYNCGHTIFIGGKTENEYIENQSNAAYKLYMYCWNRYECIEKDEDGFFRPKDCDICTACD